MIPEGRLESFDIWRSKARSFLLHRTPPELIKWQNEELSLFDHLESEDTLNLDLQTPLFLPKKFLDLAQTLSFARADDKWGLLYRIAYRLIFENKHLLEIHTDADTKRAMLLNKSIKRDIHKMHAFVRFKKHFDPRIEKGIFVAWHKPEHLTLAPSASFFVKRFGDKPWSIFTPDLSAHWDLKNLRFDKGMAFKDFNIKDQWDDMWKTYYASIYNPARINIKMMKQEMPVKYWDSMPEAEIIKELVRRTPSQLQEMQLKALSLPSPPPQRNLTRKQLQSSIDKCTACPHKTQNCVLGSGSPSPQIVVLEENPSRVTQAQSALMEMGIKSSEIYQAYAYKQPLSKDQPKKVVIAKDLHTCRPWLQTEIQLLKPRFVLSVGDVNATVLSGKKQPISHLRAKAHWSEELQCHVIYTWSSLDRDFETHPTKKQELLEDLSLLKRLCYGAS